jgi:hypothetical protein
MSEIKEAGMKRAGYNALLFLAVLFSLACWGVLERASSFSPEWSARADSLQAPTAGRNAVDNSRLGYK